jgi:predicted nucleotidyltransferase
MPEPSCSDSRRKLLTYDEIPIVKSIEEIDVPMARERLEGLIKESHVLGVMLWGSRATGFGAPTTDWDALIYVTEEYYDSLEMKDTIWLEFDESVEPKKLVIDFSPVSDSWFRQQMDSPLDIDHSPYAEGVVIYDPSGKLEEWRKKLARYPEEEHEERLKNKFALAVGAFGAGRIDHERGFTHDSKLNLYRSIVASVNLWFSMRKSWTPPLKWWTPHAKKMGITEETYKLFCKAIDTPSVETVGAVLKHLREMILADGYEFPNDFITAFLETIHVDGRPGQIRHSYM